MDKLVGCGILKSNTNIIRELAHHLKKSMILEQGQHLGHTDIHTQSGVYRLAPATKNESVDFVKPQI